MGRSGGGSRSSGSKSSGFKSKSSSGSSASSSNTKNKPNNSHDSDVSSSLLGHNAAILTAVGAALFLVNRKKDEKTLYEDGESLNEDGKSLNEDGESLNEDIQKCLNNGDKTCSEFYYKFFDDKYNECALSVKENTQTKEIIDCNSFLQMKELFNTHLNTK